MIHFRSNMRLGAAALVLLAAVVLQAEARHERKSYSGFSVYRSSPQTEQHVEALKELQTAEHEGEVEFWREPSFPNKTVDIMVSPEAEDDVRTQLRISRVPFKKVVYDLGELIRRTSPTRSGLNRDGKRLEDLLEPKEFYASFQSYSMIEAKLKALAESDSRVKLEEIGKSYERRPLYLVRVSNSQANDPKKPIIFIDAGHHAREWASHATIMYALESLLGYNVPMMANAAKAVQNDSLSAQLEKYDFWFVPVVNPDGYEYSRNYERLWRKTRSKNGSPCIGTDPNRNYPYMWKSSNACSLWSNSQTYSGPKALSEPETAALANVLLNSGREISMYLSLHSFGGYILTPYGYAAVIPDNMDELARVAEVGAKAIYSLRNTKYRHGPASIVLYEAPGGSDDFAYAMAKIRLSYTIELAESGNTMFTMPAKDIVPTAQEAVMGIAAMVNAI